jgi:hypothetical protein
MEFKLRAARVKFCELRDEKSSQGGVKSSQGGSGKKVFVKKLDIYFKKM